MWNPQNEIELKSKSRNFYKKYKYEKLNALPACHRMVEMNKYYG